MACYGMEPYPEPYSPPFPHLRSALGHSVGPWHYDIDPVMAAVSDPTPPRGHDVPDHRGVGQRAHSKVMNYADENEQEAARPASATSSISLNNASVSYKALLSKEMRLKAYFQAKYDNLKLKMLFPPSTPNTQ